MSQISAKYLISSQYQNQCPAPDMPEYAFIGRSNVGKSSLINLLADNKNLAKTSGTPGKTRLINHFLFEDSWYLVDLPGYGYAKISKSRRNEWNRVLEEYVIKRTNLVCMFVLIDASIPPQKIDFEFLEWLANLKARFVIAFTKTDKKKQKEVSANIKSFKKKMSETWPELPKMFHTSAEKKTGKNEILEFINKMNESATLDNSQ